MNHFQLNEQVWFSLSHPIKKVIEKRREHAYRALDMNKIALGTDFLVKGLYPSKKDYSSYGA
jgi:hypothetical protein